MQPETVNYVPIRSRQQAELAVWPGVLVWSAKRSMRKPCIGLFVGDPSGIGPELVAKLLATPRAAELADIVVIGDPRTYRAGAQTAGVPDARPRFLECLQEAEYPTGKATAAAGAFVLRSLELAVGTLERGEIDALVYAPLNKQAMRLAGSKHPDELRFFADLLGFAGPVSEINISGGLWTSRVTSHIPISAVSREITADKVYGTTELLCRVLQSAGVAAPRIAVAALNPHAGEGGLVGTEEITVIRPAVERARQAGIDASGPWPADTIFVAAKRGVYDGVVTMYHDQGQIALKLLGSGRGVTVAGGLPVPITTPAHGTAFDIAGKGIADPGAIREAFEVACRMVRRRS